MDLHIFILPKYECVAYNYFENVTTYLDQNLFGPIVLLFYDRSFSVQPPANKTEDRTIAKKAFISTIKSKVESTTGLKLLPVYDEEKKHKTRGPSMSFYPDFILILS